MMPLDEKGLTAAAKVLSETYGFRARDWARPVIEEYLKHAASPDFIGLAQLYSETAHRELRLRVALEWYADRANYDYDGRVLVNASAPRSQPPLLDLGERARGALEALTSTGKSAQEVSLSDIHIFAGGELEAD